VLIIDTTKLESIEMKAFDVEQKLI